MYQITKATKSIINSLLYKEELFLTIDCSEEEINSKILPKLARLAAADNLHYKRINSNSRTVFKVSIIDARSANGAVNYIDNGIKFAINNYNKEVNQHNVMARRGNKKACKPLDENRIPAVSVNQYLDTFYVGDKLELINNSIIVEER